MPRALNATESCGDRCAARSLRRRCPVSVKVTRSDFGAHAGSVTRAERQRSNAQHPDSGAQRLLALPAVRLWAGPPAATAMGLIGKTIEGTYVLVTSTCYGVLFSLGVRIHTS